MDRSGGARRAHPTSTPGRRARRGAVVLALLLAPSLAGCVEVVAAGVPTPLLQSQGWSENVGARETESGLFGLARKETRAYEDAGRERGYPGRLVVITLKTPVTPPDEDLSERLRDAIEAWAARQGIALGPREADGARRLIHGAESRWFVYNGTAEASSLLFTRNAEMRVFGEVWTCSRARTAVVVAGFAQVTDARTVGGLITQPGRDPTTWHEIVADPQGSVEGLRGSNGLAWNVVCT